MNDILKWVVLSSPETDTKINLEKLAAEYKNIPDSDPRFSTPSAQRLIASIENPPFDDVSLLCYPQESYPQKLKILKNPPPVLYVRGDPTLLVHGHSIAVVGSRDASSYGLSVTSDFCRDFCEAGFSIISGGARGIDSAAAQTALKFRGKTVIVLGCGVDVAYPAENRTLFDKVVSRGGAIVSEYPFGTKPLPAYFPQRNRIIAALADGCVVTEAGLRSGSLITANLATELRKPLFAVPGNITSRYSSGTNHLIRTGAYMALSGMQVAAEIKVILSFGSAPPEKKQTKFSRLPLNREAPSKAEALKPAPRAVKAKKVSPSGLSEEDSKIISAISSDSKTLAEISDRTGINSAALAPKLVMLELRGLIKKEYGEKYCVQNPDS